MKNVVFIVNIKGKHPPDFFEYCFNTWSFWTKKNNATLFVLEEPFAGTEKLAAHLQKYFAFEVLKRNKIDFDQVAIVDADTMIKWDCPNFFNISKSSFRAVLDDELPKWVIASLATYQFLFPKTNVVWWEYFNSGVMILNKNHGSLLSEFLTFMAAKEKEIAGIHSGVDLRAGFDQTLFNFFLKGKKMKISYLPKIFNFYHLLGKKMLEKKEFVDCSYIWHFNGIAHSERKKYMRETWKLIKTNYRR
jgi:hypothetical protein